MKVLAHSYVCPKGVKLNGEPVFDTQAEENPLKSAYQQLGVEYPKFYKMDVLSKMAFIGTELLLPFFPAGTDLENDLSLIFANTSSSQHTDNLFVDSYEKLNNPSPSLFVYTLPNIVTGELCIRHKWYGENCFFIEEQFNPKNYAAWAQSGFSKGNALCLCGWVEAKTNGEQECFLFLLSPSDKTEHTIEIELSTLIKQYRNE
ncbi:3-oxoacyl-ACP synthase [Fluviicola sp.]|uniref:3-oxoacyl-ACP synthase n=1 Tax=Fluviicola sp. TaxID=1917219 RepID=UPI0031D4FDF8